MARSMTGTEAVRRTRLARRQARRRVAFAGVVLALLLSFAAGPEAKPRRVVSLNLCTDQLVLMLARRENIASVTYLAPHVESSYMAAAVAGLRVNHGRAEEVLPLEPDLVFAGTYTTRATVRLLRRFGYPVVAFDLARDFTDVRAQVGEAARLLGEEARGRAILARMDRGLARARAEPGAARPSAAIFLPNGNSAGAGTFIDALLRAAGYRNFAAEAGLVGRVPLGLERLLVGDPEVLVLATEASVAPSLAETGLRHPALLRWASGKPVVALPTRLWNCPGPMLADAVALLAAARP